MQIIYLPRSVLLGYCWDISNICHEEIIPNYLAGCSTWSDKSVKQKKRCAGAAGPTYFKSSFVTEETEEQVVSVWIDQHTDGQLNQNQVQGKFPSQSQSYLVSCIMIRMMRIHYSVMVGLILVLLMTFPVPRTQNSTTTTTSIILSCSNM